MSIEKVQEELMILVLVIKLNTIKLIMFYDKEGYMNCYIIMLYIMIKSAQLQNIY